MRTSPLSHLLRSPGGSAPTAAASEPFLGPGHCFDAAGGDRDFMARPVSVSVTCSFFDFGFF